MIRAFCYSLVGLFLSLNTYAVSDDFIGAAGVAVQGAAVSTMYSGNFSKCCGGNPACCAMAATTALSALSLLSKSDTAKSQGNQFNECEISGGLFCNTTALPGADTANPNNPDGTIPEGFAPNEAGDGQQAGAGSGATGSGSYNLGDVANGINASVNGIINDLTEDGYIISADKQSLKFPNGDVKSFSSLSSPSALRSAGFSSEDVLEAEKAMAKTKGELKSGNPLLKFGYAGRNSRAKRNTRKAAIGGGPNYNALMKQFMNQKKANSKQARGVANVNGLSKSLSNGEKIGVASDNLFYMVHRRYQKKTAEKTFMP